VAHAVHHVSLLRVWCLPPDQLWLAFSWEHLLKQDVRVPVACNQHGRLSTLLLFAVLDSADLTLQLGDIFVLAEPPPPDEVDNSFLAAALLMDLHCLTNVDVWSANDEVVERHDWELHLVPLVEVGQVNVGPKLLGHQEALAAELDVCLLVGLVDVIRLFSAAVAGCHWWVMRHLLSQVFKVIGDELKCFA